MENVIQFATDAPTVMVLNMTQSQGVPYTVAVWDSYGTNLNLTSNLWITVDYTNFNNGNDSITVTIDNDSIGPYYTVNTTYQLSYYLKTLEPYYPKWQRHYFNVTLVNEPALITPMTNKTVKVGTHYFFDLDLQLKYDISLYTIT
jgi:hypothetical protein